MNMLELFAIIICICYILEGKEIANIKSTFGRFNITLFLFILLDMIRSFIIWFNNTFTFNEGLFIIFFGLLLLGVIAILVVAAYEDFRN